MSFDYDLVVIGSTLEGIYAAKKAVLLQARVALVTQTDQKYLNYASFIYLRCLTEITNLSTKLQQLPWGINSESKTIPKATFQSLKNYGDLVAESIISENSLEDLAILGVDVIDGKGEFCRLPKQAFLVNNRQLRSRNYLLATSAQDRIDPHNYNLEQFNYLTPDDLWQQDLTDLPNNIVFIANHYFNYRHLELAQGLARLGKKITLATLSSRTSTFLGTDTIEASRLFEAQFAADGIKILLNCPLKQIKKVDNQILLQLGNRTLETEAIVLVDSRQPNITGLNLEGVGVKYLQKGIIVNEKLQTTNQTIYACGDLLGGASLPHLAQYEVDIALKNMFSFPWFKRDYRYLPKVMLTQPNLASIGLTKITDSQKQERNIYLVTQHFQSTIAAQITGITTGWCQFIIKDNGTILGCTIICDRAIEMINLIALMMRHEIGLNRNPIQGLLSQEIPYVTPSLTEIFNQVTIAFHQQKLQRDRRLRARLETWFNWRR
jgi:pyruvate/2-oxoglutarate dehydrogenase complex dihydrolipoamide dehydrogenase (E3) component